MKLNLTALCAVAATALGAASLGGAAPASVGAAEHSVIVILRDQRPDLPPQRHAMQARSAALKSDQETVYGRLPARAQRIRKHFKTINAFATSVTPAEESQLANDPSVLAVVPDRLVRVRAPGGGGATNGVLAAATAAASAALAAAAPDSQPSGPAAGASLCNTLEPEALQLTNTAFLDPAVPQAQSVRDGNGQLVTGRGVKIAFLADNLDTSIAGFTHTDGSPVFIDYQDFTGVPGSLWDGSFGESFLDASSIAAQDTPNGTPLRFDISGITSGAGALPSPCLIQVRGAAPGASLVGIRVLSAQTGTISALVEGIEYAYLVDDVDVISESLAVYTFPDPNTDPMSLANQAAVRAGVTVVTVTGDAGPGGTIGIPGSVPEVITVAATTQLRTYAQLGWGVAPLSTGYVDNDIASFSSSGFSQRSARTVDVVAPGDTGWSLCSLDQVRFPYCRTLTATPEPAPIQFVGGTSESAPLVAGEAALVIQAYRSTHAGRTPSPALVKRLVMSTASDLGAPPEEQGAGLVNSLAAVYAALAADGAAGARAHPQEASSRRQVISDTGSFRIADLPGAKQQRSFTLTNLGTAPQWVQPSLRALRATVASGHQVMTIDTSVGVTPLAMRTITVPANADHLDVAIAYPTTPFAAVNPFIVMGLLDPMGRLVEGFQPQSLDNGVAHIEAVRPMPGNWTVAMYTLAAGIPYSYSGPIQLDWSAQRMMPAGSVFPDRLVLAPGANATFTARFALPEAPGDSAAEIVLNSGDASSAAGAVIPISLRALVPVSPSGGTFTGNLGGGNGRPNTGPTLTYTFDVPFGVDDMNLVVDVPDSGNLLQGILVDPKGLPYSINSNEDPITGAPLNSMQLNRYGPVPGRWQFILTNYFSESGQRTSLPFDASIQFNARPVAATGLPNSLAAAVSASGPPQIAKIRVRNTSRVTQMYFVDARRSVSTIMQLPQFPACGTTFLPNDCIGFTVPTQTSVVSVGASSTVPMDLLAYQVSGTLSAGNLTFSPEIYGRPDPKTGSTRASMVATEVPYSTWYAFPNQSGTFGPEGAQPYPVSMTVTAFTKAFDTAMVADSGDIWEDFVSPTSTFNPLVLAPGETGVIHVSIHPDASEVGRVLDGALYVDTFNFVQFNGDEVARLPYRFRVVK